MKTTQKAQRLLEQIARIKKMERGKICAMSGRSHFNHQTWEEGRNIARYVLREDLDELQEAIDGYTLFTRLMQEYADEIIRLTRIERSKRHRNKSKQGKN